MPGSVSLNLSHRTVERLGLFWNRITPTWRSRTVNREISAAAQKDPAIVCVYSHKLSIRKGIAELPVPGSRAYAACLSKAGVKKIELPAGLEQKDVKTILNALSDRELETATQILQTKSISIDIGGKIELSNETKENLLPCLEEALDHKTFLAFFISSLAAGGIGGALLSLELNSILDSFDQPGFIFSVVLSTVAGGLAGMILIPKFTEKSFISAVAKYYNRKLLSRPENLTLPQLIDYALRDIPLLSKEAEYLISTHPELYRDAKDRLNKYKEGRMDRFQKRVTDIIAFLERLLFEQTKTMLSNLSKIFSSKKCLTVVEKITSRVSPSKINWLKGKFKSLLIWSIFIPWLLLKGLSLLFRTFVSLLPLLQIDLSFFPRQKSRAEKILQELEK